MTVAEAKRPQRLPTHILWGPCGRAGIHRAIAGRFPCIPPGLGRGPSWPLEDLSCWRRARVRVFLQGNTAEKIPVRLARRRTRAVIANLPEAVAPLPRPIV